MNRAELLSTFHYTVPEKDRVRVILHTDAASQADDQFAIMQDLLSPSLEIRGIIGAHFESMYDFPSEAAEAHLRGTSAVQSLEEIRKVLGLAGVSDVFSCIGAVHALDQSVDFASGFLFPDGSVRTDDGSKEALSVLLPDSPGAEYIIQEALADDPRPLYLVCQAGLTDPAIALLREPEIADRLTLIWTGGGMYPYGNFEFNLCQDVRAAQVIFASKIPVWQIPQDTCSQLGAGLSELDRYVRPCGEIGAYLYQRVAECSLSGTASVFGSTGRPGSETWCLSDLCASAVLLFGGFEGRNYTVETAPVIEMNQSYRTGTAGRPIRIYHEIDTRAEMADFYAKLHFVYGTGDGLPGRA